MMPSIARCCIVGLLAVGQLLHADIALAVRGQTGEVVDCLKLPHGLPMRVYVDRANALAFDRWDFSGKRRAVRQGRWYYLFAKLDNAYLIGTTDSSTSISGWIRQDDGFLWHSRQGCVLINKSGTNMILRVNPRKKDMTAPHGRDGEMQLPAGSSAGPFPVAARDPSAVQIVSMIGAAAIQMRPVPGATSTSGIAPQPDSAGTRSGAAEAHREICLCLAPGIEVMPLLCLSRHELETWVEEFCSSFGPGVEGQLLHDIFMLHVQGTAYKNAPGWTVDCTVRDLPFLPDVFRPDRELLLDAKQLFRSFRKRLNRLMCMIMNMTLFSQNTKLGWVPVAYLPGSFGTNDVLESTGRCR